MGEIVGEDRDHPKDRYGNGDIIASAHVYHRPLSRHREGDDR